MKRIFAVGSAGFVGSHLVRRLLASQEVETVTVFDNLSSGHLEWVPVGDIRVRFVKGSARDFDYLRVAMAESECDTVFHLAANPDIARAVKEPTIDFEQGTVLTQNVVEAMRVNGVKRLVYFSGSGIYGETADTLVEDYGPLHPISPYGANKLASEAIICAYSHMFGIVARVLRPANIVGPRQTHGVGLDFLRKISRDPTRLDILGDGSQSKSYVHIDDVCSAVMMLIEKCISDEVEAPEKFVAYNIAAPDYLTVTQIAEMAFVAAGVKLEGLHFKYAGGDRGWKGDVPRVRFNVGKLQSIGWRCRRTSREAMADALAAMWAEIQSKESVP